MRRRFSLRFLVAVVGVAGLLMACSPGSKSETSGSAGDEVAAGSASHFGEVNRETGAIIWPGSRFGADPEESNLFMNASGVAMSECAQANGVDFKYSLFPFPEIYRHSNYYGVWRLTDAERFGFVSPRTEADLAANGIVQDSIPSERTQPDEGAVDNSGITDEGWATVDSCAKQPEVKRFIETNIVPRSPWLNEVMAAQVAAEESDRVAEIYAELDRCYIADGMEPQADSPGSVKGAQYDVINEEQIKLAVRVVVCKDEARFVERILDVVADYQSPVIDKYAREFAAQRADIDKAVAEARAYLAERVPAA